MSKLELVDRESRAARVAGLRSKGGMGCGWKRGARKALTSDQAWLNETASAALDGDSKGSGRVSIY